MIITVFLINWVWLIEQDVYVVENVSPEANLEQ